MKVAMWSPDQPIFRQLRDVIAAQMLEGTLSDGQPLPSVRKLAARYGLSALTVLKAYQQLAEEQLIEKQRGRGLYLRAGACAALRLAERERFLASDWPRLRQHIERLGLSPVQLLQVPAARVAAEDLPAR